MTAASPISFSVSVLSVVQFSQSVFTEVTVISHFSQSNSVNRIQSNKHVVTVKIYTARISFCIFRSRKMASTSTVLRTCGLIFYLIFQVYATVNNSSQLFISSLKVGSVTCDENICKYLLNVNGGEFLGHYPWRLTSEEGAKGGTCEVFYPNYELKEIETTQWFSKVEVLIPKKDGKIYFCLHEKGGNSGFGGKWVHQGDEHFLEPKNDVSTEKEKYL